MAWGGWTRGKRGVREVAGAWSSPRSVHGAVSLVFVLASGEMVLVVL